MSQSMKTKLYSLFTKFFSDELELDNSLEILQLQQEIVDLQNKGIEQRRIIQGKDLLFHELERKIKELSNNKTLANLIRHDLEVCVPGEVKYNEKDIEESETVFLKDANDIHKNNAFQLIVGKAMEYERDRTIDHSMSEENMDLLHMSRAERIAFGQGAIHLAAYFKEEVGVLSARYLEKTRSKGAAPLTAEEKFESI